MKIGIIFLSLLSIISCQTDKTTPERSPIASDELIKQSKITWKYSYADSSDFSNANYNDPHWPIVYTGRPDSFRMATSIPVVKWHRLTWSGDADIISTHLLTSSLNFEVTEPTALLIFSNTIGENFSAYLQVDSVKSTVRFLLSDYIKRNPTKQFLAIRNDSKTQSMPYEPSGVKFPQNIPDPTSIIREDKYKRLAKTIMKMDTLLTHEQINQFRNYIAPDYFDDGVSKADKMNFYQFISARMNYMKFEYVNFTFEELSDGRVRVMYGYNLYEADSLVDAGYENRFFRQDADVWREVGNHKRFYRSVLSSQLMRDDVNFYVYLPPDYLTNFRKSYPVIYIFNDFGDKTTDWIAYRADKILDELIRRKEIEPAIVIFMDGGPSLYMKSEKKGGYNFEDFFLTSVCPNYEETLRITRGRDHRYLAGFGMGGLAAMYYQLVYPTYFGGVTTINGRFEHALRAPHMDNNVSDYWDKKYPLYFINKMPDYILEKLQFKVIKKVGGDDNGHTPLTTELQNRKAKFEVMMIDDTWQEKLPLVFKKMISWK